MNTPINKSRNQRRRKPTKADEPLVNARGNTPLSLVHNSSATSAIQFVVENSTEDKKNEDDYRSRLQSKLSLMVKEMIDQFVDLTEGLPKKLKKEEMNKEPELEDDTKLKEELARKEEAELEEQRKREEEERLKKLQEDERLQNSRRGKRAPRRAKKA